MELVKNKLSTTILKTSKYSQFTINDDFNVPDAKPDAGRLIQNKTIWNGSLQVQEMSF